jgi:hypothetical protein
MGGGGGGCRAVKQLALSGLPMDNSEPGRRLAVPLETPHLLVSSAAIVAAAPKSSVNAAAESAAQTTSVPPSGAPTQLLLMSSTEVEFREPLLPQPAAVVQVLRQQQAAAFHEQEGQYQMSSVSSSLSPPQVSSPTLSSCSFLMDLSFSDSIYETAAAIAEATGLTTPPTEASSSSSEVNLTEDNNSLPRIIGNETVVPAIVNPVAASKIGDGATAGRYSDQNHLTVTGFFFVGYQYLALSVSGISLYGTGTRY